jgi:hypothetical protein
MSQTKAQLISDLVQALNFTGTASAPANGAFLSAANTLALATNSAQRLTIDSSGRFLVGTTSSRTVGGNTQKILQIETTDATAGIAITRNSATSTASMLSFGKSRGTSNGTSTIVQDGDQLGRINFCGADGTDAVSEAAKIEAFVDGTPGSNDMPGRLTFSTTADGAVSATERMRIDSTGRVLVGTTTPDPFGNRQLTVASSSSAHLEIRSGTSASGIIVFTDGTSGGTDSFKGQIKYNQANDFMSFETNGANERLRIDSSGKVGIGTTPEEIFHIKGPTEAIGTRDGVLLQHSTASNAADNGLPLVWSGYISASNTNYGLASICGRKENSIDNNGAAYLQFGTGSDAGAISEKMRIKSNGNVGIGTSSPDALLHLSGTSPFIRFTDTVDSSHYAHIGHSDTSVFVLDADAANAHADSGIEFKVDNSSVMFLKNGGNVGIGTTSPAFKLHVDGTSRFGSTRINSTTESTDGAFNDLVIGDYSSNRGISILSGATGQGAVGFAKSGTTADGYLAYVHNGTATSSAMTLKSQGHIKFNAGSSTKVYIEHNGKVGIGTTSPTQTLDVTASNTVGIAQFTNTATSFSNSCYTVHIDSSAHTSNMTAAGAFAVDVNAGRAMTIDGNGDVGIGTASPNSLLELSGGGNTILTVNTGNNSGDNSQIAFGDSADADVGFINYDHGTNAMQFRVNASERLRIDSSGRVGIGTTSLSNKLEISNTTSDKGILIKTTANNYHTICGDANRTSSGDNILRIDSKWNGTVVNRIRMLAGSDTTNKDDGIICFDTASGGSMGERMRILSDGAVCINASSRPVVGTEFLGVQGGSTSTSVGIGATVSHNEGIPFFASNSSNSFSDRLMRFAAGSGGDTRGTITFNGSVMVYGGTSDYRLKENITSISNGITKLKDLKPINFNWIKDETNTSIMGFLAHEVQEVMPQVVVGTKDEVNSEGKPEYQEIDLGGMTPLLVAALQEAISKIETLETEVAALKAA